MTLKARYYIHCATMADGAYTVIRGATLSGEGLSGKNFRRVRASSLSRKFDNFAQNFNNSGSEMDQTSAGRNFRHEPKNVSIAPNKLDKVRIDEG